MSEWKESTLGELAEITMGQSPRGEDCNEAGHGTPLLNGPTEFGSHHPSPVQFTTDARKVSNTHDILFCVRGSTTGRMNWSDQQYAIGRGIASIRHRNGPAYNPFIRGLIEYHLPGILTAATGSTFPNVSKDQLNNLRIHCPPLKEQKTIAEILSSLDDKIELNNQINENLEALTQAIFKRWFVDFEFPNENGQPYKSSGGEMVESELGEIPRGWPIRKLGDVTDVKGGSTPSTKDASYWNGDVHWTSPKDLSALCFPVLLETAKLITKKGLESISSGLLPRHTLLLSSRAPIGYLAITEIETAINQGYIAINGKEGFHNLFFLYWLKSNMDLVKSRANGSTFLEISKSNFKEIKVVLPTREIHDIYVENVQSLFAQLVNNERESRSLGQLRDELLRKLISGELSIRSDSKSLTPSLAS